MPEPLRQIIEAISSGDAEAFAHLLKAHPRAAIEGFAAADQLEGRIAHWIYAGDTALHVAAAGYRLEMANLLIAAGANVSAAHNRRRAQPLHYAADGSLEHPNWDAQRQVAMIRCLLKHGADVHAADANGATPLHRAVRTRCVAAVRCLFDAGADAAAQNKSGSTAFHLAVQNTGRGGSGSEMAKTAQLEIIRLFWKRGVSVELRDGMGKTVLDAAIGETVQAALRGNATSS